MSLICTLPAGQVFCAVAALTSDGSAEPLDAFWPLALWQPVTAMANTSAMPAVVIILEKICPA